MQPSEELRRLVRRVSASLDGERLLALALGQVLEEGAEVAFCKPPKPVTRPPRPPRSADGDEGRDDRPRRTRDSRGRDDRGSRGRGRDDRGGRGRGRDDRGGRGRGRDDRGGRGRGRDDRGGRGRGRDDRPDRTRRRPRRDDSAPPNTGNGDNHGSFTTPDGDVEHWETVQTPTGAREQRSDQTKLYVNMGRRHGLNDSAELAQHFTEQGELAAEELGRIQVRESHSYVFVATNKAEALIEKLSDSQLNDNVLRVEEAKR